MFRKGSGPSGGIGSKSATKRQRHRHGSGDTDGISGGSEAGGLSIFDELALSPRSRGAHNHIDDYGDDVFDGNRINQVDEEKNDREHGRGTGVRVEARNHTDAFNTYPSQQQQQQQQQGPHNISTLEVSTTAPTGAEALIYAAPTVDTLGDGSTMLQYYNNTITNNNNTSTTTMTPNGHHHPPHLRSVLSTSSSSTLTYDDSNNTIDGTIKRIRQRVLQQNAVTAAAVAQAAGTQNPKKNQSNKNKEFQLEEDAMTVTVRRIPVSERSAFNKKLPSDCFWDDYDPDNCNVNVSSKKKISPSFQHWKILQLLSNTTYLRQVSFSPSVGPASDVFWDEHSEERDGCSLSAAAATTTTKRDGRYRSIHPVQGTVESLPDEPPMLSNKKYRLPMRTDVGFQNPTEKEILQKQTEIRMETEWEEASPRLIVLVTSDDLGKAVDDDDDDVKKSSSNRDGKTNEYSRRRNTPNDGVRGLPGMPWAGPDLIEAKARNQRHFELKGRQHNRHDDNHTQQLDIKQQLKDIAERRRTSMLAPPLDATHSSSSLGWRPRPFHDRPPGLRYALVSPLAVDFAVGNNIEPLVCSLSLYWFPQQVNNSDCGDSDAGRIGGKVSEEFYFPAGDWDGKLQIDAIGSSSAADQEGGNASWTAKEVLLRELWGKRKHKALFSYDPLMLGGEFSDEDLYVVFQVYKVSHPGAKDLYLTSGCSDDDRELSFSSEAARSSKSWKERLKNQFQKDSSRSNKFGDQESMTDTAINDAEVERTYLRANSIFERYGTQLTTPLCFGITNLFPDGSSASSRGNIWPRGQVQQGMNLYAASSRPESQEEFENRLRSVVFPGDRSIFVGTSESTDDDNDPDGTGAGTAINPIDTTGFSTPHKKKGAMRRFMTPRLSSKKEVGSFTYHNTSSSILDPSLVNGSVTLFSSYLGVDFLQAMLVTPPELIDKVSISYRSEAKEASGSALEVTTEALTIPRVLVDASGGSAIMIDPNKSISAFSNDDITAKRSDLVRLPTSRPAEFLDSSEFREILFLPPRLRKRYDLDFFQPDHRSVLNLLFLYPRAMVMKCHQGKEYTHCRYTIRIQLIQNRSTTSNDGTVESTNHVLARFHNPAAWGGSTLLRSVYTRIPCDAPGSSQGRVGAENQTSFSLRDEHKLDLPTVLDGSYFLQFSLFEVEFVEDLNGKDSLATPSDAFHGSGRSIGGEGCRLHLKFLAESSIPLSSSSMKDAKSGAKATTIIPNGTHRIGLGNYQLQVETRLLSSIHVSDPSIAAMLRDFPSLTDAVSNNRSGGGLIIHDQFASVGSGRGSVASKQLSHQGSTCSRDVSSYPTMLSAVSGSAIAGHFQPLIVAHILNLILPSRDDDGYNEAIAKSLNENMQSLLMLLWRMKGFFLSSNTPTGECHLRAFIKCAVDALDESSFGSSTNLSTVEESASVVDDEETALDGDFEPGQEVEFDGGAIRKRKKQSLGDLDVLRISRSMSAMDSSDVPFSRVAFGISKTDRMRLEAEMELDTSRFTQLFDDDETVVTIATTRQSEFKKKEGRYSIENNKTQLLDRNQRATDKEIAVTLPGTMEPNRDDRGENHGLDFSVYHKSISELAIGKRMKNAAQVMLAPCVMTPPALTSVLLCRPIPGQSSSDTDITDNVSGVFRARVPQTARSVLSAKMSLEDVADSVVASSGSDIEDDENEILEGGDAVLEAFHTTKGLFRSPRNCNTIQFTIPHNWMSRKSFFPVDRGDFLYETLMVLWIHAWLNHMKITGHDFPTTTIVDSSDLFDKCNLFAFYYQQMDVLLPLLLKSIVLRYGQTYHMSQKRSARIILDTGHQRVFEAFFEMMAVGLMGEAMSDSASNSDSSSLSSALLSCELVVDFIIGLFPIVHPAHMETLVTMFIKTLRACETSYVSKTGVSFSWDAMSLKRAKSSRQLRLRTVEKLSALPNFVALNFPPVFLEKASSSTRKASSCTWTNQPTNIDIDTTRSASDQVFEPLIEDDHLRPVSGWLASLLTSECLSICALSCEAVVAEALAHIEVQDSSRPKDQGLQSSLKHRPTASLQRSDLLMFQSIAIHAITCVHEVMLRRHAMDKRFQNDSSRERIAALFLQPIFDKSIASVRWLARMESTHKVRSIWLLCFIYVLQEAPESLVRKAIRTYSTPKDLRIHRFIRLLRLGSSTFQSFIDQKRHCMFPSEIDQRISPWLLQESFNILCATTIIVVEESAGPISVMPDEQRKMMQGILDLLLHVLTTPQSSVTHLRAVGGAIQALEKFGASLFLEITGHHLQHWMRVVLGLMNHTALSVRSIAVDFVISFLGGVFQIHGNIDDVSIQIATILPEVVAREIGLFTVSGLIKTFEGVEMALWPLRRSFADLEDANPMDDSRVDPQLSPILGKLCRSCQAIIDGVMIELRLLGENCTIAGVKISPPEEKYVVFDADEESLFEAATFFEPETAPMQRLRWLMTLKDLHVEKGHWIEAGECLILGAKTIIESMPHLGNIWRPSRFLLWSDGRRSLWLSTVGEEVGNPHQGNAQVMAFAGSFLEPSWLVGTSQGSDTLKLPQPSLSSMSKLLANLNNQAVSMYAEEGSVDGLTYFRLEAILRMMMAALDKHQQNSFALTGTKRSEVVQRRKKFAEEEASLREANATITFELTKLAELLLLNAQDGNGDASPTKKEQRHNEVQAPKRTKMHHFVRLLLSGVKPSRFLQSTGLPTFLEWDQACICRVPQNTVQTTLESTPYGNSEKFETVLCTEFGKVIRDSLLQDIEAKDLVVIAGKVADLPGIDTTKTYLNICLVQPNIPGSVAHADSWWDAAEFQALDVRHFIHRRQQKTKSNEEDNHGDSTSSATIFVETTVAHAFPCPLSRQRSIAVSEFVSSSK